MAVTHFLFDIGNVLVDWNPDHLFRDIFDDPGERDFFLTEVCPQSWNIEQDRGRSWPDGIAEAKMRHPDYAEAIQAYWDRWLDTIAGPIHETVNIQQSLRSRGYPVFALSNFARETFALAEVEYPFLKDFDGRIISAHEGMVKPDPAIFRLAEERFNLPRETTLFIDDSEANIATAREFGFQIHHFSEPPALKTHLRELGIAA